MTKNFNWVFIYILSFLFLHVNSFALSAKIVSKNSYVVLQNTKNLTTIKQKGGYASSSLFNGKKEIKWARKFNIVELGDINNKHLTYKLLKKDKILSIRHHIAYDWMPAFYYYTSGNNSSFVSWLHHNREFATLNPNGPFIHCKQNHYDWCQDYYYNLGNKEVFRKRVDNLVHNIKKKGFNGIFFDWASGGYILQKEYKPLLERFKQLNPHKNYFDLIAKFYKTLRQKGVFVVTNQAFRKHSYLLPFVSYDMTESYITDTKQIHKNIQIQGVGWVNSLPVTNYYPIYTNSHTIKDSLKFINLLTKYKKQYRKDGFKNFIYMNYLAPVYKKVYSSGLLYREAKPKNGIYFSYAMAKLTDNLVYAEVPVNHTLEQDNVYFYKLGKALGKSYTRLKNIGGYIRFYKHGFVLACKAHKHNIYLNISSRLLPKSTDVYDAYNKVWLRDRGKRLTVKLHFNYNQFTNKYLPIGRVYLYKN